MLILRGLAGSSLLALMAGTAAAQVTTVGTNRSEVQDSGRDNRAQVENAGEGNDRNNSLVVFNGNGNRATVGQFGDDNSATTREQGDSNISAVRQFGFRNSATVVQVGNGNGSSVDQYIDPRIAVYGDRTVSVEQRGNANSSTVTQVHFNNSATVRQTADGAVSTIYQYSAGNVATVTMTGGSPDAANRSHVEQTRIDPVVTNNVATVNLSGGLNLSYLFQFGANNKADHSSSGGGNVIVGRYYGNSLQSSVVQEGFRNFATLTQFAGDRNSSLIEQRQSHASFPQEGDRQVYVSQGGSDNSSTVIQRRGGNTVVVNQSGGGTVSSVLQDGPNNFARANLLNGSPDALNKSTITQEKTNDLFDARHLADVTVRGLGNESNVTQTGMRHVASVDLGGGGVGTDEAGRRRGNSVTIVQNRTMPRPPSQVAEAGHTARVQVGLLQGGGLGTVTSIEQRGQHPNIGNDAIVRQEGQYDRVSVLQSTRDERVDGGGVANIATRGVLNQVRLEQYGREFAFITQGFGRESTFTATQYDSGGSRLGAGLFTTGRGSNSLNASQNGDRNAVDVWQEGTGNGVTVWQKMGSSDNSISINQGRTTFSAVDGFGCDRRCQFATDAVALIVQSGQFNRAAIVQYDFSNGSAGASGTEPALQPTPPSPVSRAGFSLKAAIEQNGTGSSTLPNIARIIQFTTGAEASILQTADVGPSQAGDPSSGAPGDRNYFPGGARSAEARIRQGSGALSARIEQRGRGQHAFIDQTGPNAASILQEIGATNATAIITQSGSGNSYNIVQNQPGQYTNVSQTGTNNSVTNVITRP